MTHTTYRILSCDGGGIRGVITAKLLQALDPSVIKNIDLFAGTSTGSIIALGLASGVPIDTIVELYSSQKACSKIFQPYLPLAKQDRLGRAFAAGEQRSSPPRKRPRTAATSRRRDLAL
jgi:patatin-like phospholipase/acyl hydrolase